MGIFYYDEKLNAYEKLFKWNEALLYLEDLYSKNKNISILNSLVGFAWYYLTEGPIISEKYERDTSLLPLRIWKKYIDLGEQEEPNSPSFCFITGYTLSLNGLYINEEYEKKGARFMKKCLTSSDSVLIHLLAENFFRNSNSPKHIPLKDGKAVCTQLFKSDSLVDRYFREIYTC